MHMQVLTVAPESCQPVDLGPAVRWLERGGIVAFPTDTLYGLAVDPASALAVRDLFDLKGRSARAALPFVASSSQQVELYCGRFGSAEARLASKFWPGPLSLVFDAPASVAAEVHGGRRSVAIRVPAHGVARALAAAWGRPLPATSANRSGSAPAADVAALGELADDPRVFVIDAGAAPGGLPSTIVDARTARPLLVREGAIPWSRVLESLNE
jgi:L-threonylcarbamoyladenylate synthase